MAYTPTSTSNNQFEEEPSGEPILEIIKRDYLPYWPLLIAAGILGLVIAYMVIRYTRTRPNKFCLN